MAEAGSFPNDFASLDDEVGLGVLAILGDPSNPTYPHLIAAPNIADVAGRAVGRRSRDFELLGVADAFFPGVRLAQQMLSYRTQRMGQREG